MITKKNRKHKRQQKTADRTSTRFIHNNVIEWERESAEEITTNSEWEQMREQECYVFLLLTERGNESICWIRIPAGVIGFVYICKMLTNAVELSSSSAMWLYEWVCASLVWFCWCVWYVAWRWRNSCFGNIVAKRRKQNTRELRDLLVNLWDGMNVSMWGWLMLLFFCEQSETESRKWMLWWKRNKNKRRNTKYSYRY